MMNSVNNIDNNIGNINDINRLSQGRDKNESNSMWQSRHISSGMNGINNNGNVNINRLSGMNDGTVRSSLETGEAETAVEAVKGVYNLHNHVQI